jgi:hypothetical protein
MVTHLHKPVLLSPNNLPASPKPVKVLQHLTFPTQILLIPPNLTLKH